MIIKGLMMFLFGLLAMSSFPMDPKTVSAKITAPRKVESRRISAPVEELL